MAAAARATRLLFSRTGNTAASSPAQPRLLPRPCARLRYPEARALYTQIQAPLSLGSSSRRQSRQGRPNSPRRLMDVRWQSEKVPQLKEYSFDELQSRLSSSSPTSKPLVLVDVREPHELQRTGRIPGAHNLPVSSLPGHLFLPPDEFEDALGWSKPQPGDEVVFYCRSGVRSRAVAAMVRDEWGRGGIDIAEYPGSWSEWSNKGGKGEKVE